MIPTGTVIGHKDRPLKVSDLSESFVQIVCADRIVFRFAEDRHEVLKATGPYGCRAAKIEGGGILIFEVGEFEDCIILIDGMIHSRENPAKVGSRLQIVRPDGTGVDLPSIGDLGVIIDVR
ncbi:MAG: hypothetical protein BWY43_00567 [candidate division WS2 bacterium ADurb.Bin280]|uniref:Uncharacterized protein n=1 Tax=candidate division WS2 bacterium ADurb.Bin280 TaxID=1852829 RepID=A0A1V5SDF9_9BACT|nr:MAG: hypothetical protein BWY43_00567 [candidate division WS2 bacterium ADurb.Bin280]